MKKRLQKKLEKRRQEAPIIWLPFKEDPVMKEYLEWYDHIYKNWWRESLIAFDCPPELVYPLAKTGS